MKSKVIKNKEGQKGQVLLITIMLLATVVAVVLAVTFRSTEETKTSKLEEESQKALAAAEAGVEAALQSKDSVTGTSIVTGYNINATISGNSNTKSFTSPPLQKDEQYSLYLRLYGIDPDDSATYHKFTGSYTNGNLDFYFGETGTTNCPTVEFTVIGTDSAATDNTYIKRLLYKSCSDAITGAVAATTVGAPFEKAGYSFGYKTTIPSTDIATGTQVGSVLIVRFLSTTALSSARFVVEAQGANNLPVQGSVVTSQAQSTSTGVNKQVQLFQSYFQIPAEFFVTSF